MKPNLFTKMIIPESFNNATDQEIEDNTNGCGLGGWLGLLVPDSIFGADVSLACLIHDWMYYKGLTIEDKIQADIAFLHNLLTLTLEDYRGLADYKRVQRIKRCYVYFKAVERYGKYAFMKDIEGIKSRDAIKHLLPEYTNVIEDVELFGGEDPNDEYL